MTDREHIKMVVIPESEAANYTLVTETGIIAADEDTGGPLIDCGGCGRTLIEYLFPQQFKDVPIKCGKCGALNMVPQPS